MEKHCLIIRPAKARSAQRPLSVNLRAGLWVNSLGSQTSSSRHNTPNTPGKPTRGERSLTHVGGFRRFNRHVTQNIKDGGIA